VTLLVNGRFLRVKPTGMHRAGRVLLDGIEAAGGRIEVLAPKGVADERVDRTLWGPPGRAGDHLWEQGALAAAVRRRPLLNLINTAPLTLPRNIVWTHDLGPLVGPQWYRGAAAYGRLLLLSARRAEVVYAPSEQVRGELVAAGVAAGRTRVLRTAVDPRFAAVDPAAVDELRGRRGLDRPYLLHLGWADPRKDVATAVAAHLQLAGTRPHDLVLAGREHPVFAPVTVPEAPTVRKLGYVDDDDLPALMAGAAALVFPSRYEGFGLPPVEAMTAGTPALVSDLPAHREATWDGARFLPPGDVDAWADAMARALDGEVTVPTLPSWTAADMTGQFLAGLPADCQP
jgi:glycosyltransferase involved in cell wall biosynthesis